MCLPQGHFILKYFFPFVTSHDRSSPSARTASRSLSVCFGLKAITLESPDRLPARRDPTHLLRAGERQCASTHSRIMPQVAGCCRIFFSTQAVAKWRGERVGCAAGRVFGFVYAVSFLSLIHI